MTKLLIDRSTVEQALKALKMMGEKYGEYACDACDHADAAIDALREMLAQPERHELQAKGKHPAPCARHCEATAFQIVINNLKAQLAQPEQEPETSADGQRLDWLEKAADARKVELARSLYKTGYEIGEWPSLRVTVANGSLREAIDAAMQGRCWILGRRVQR